MANANKETDFAALIENAQETPLLTYEELVSPYTKQQLAAKEGKTAPIPKQPKLPFTCKVKRFDITEEGNYEYEEVINQALDGNIIIRYEERSITKDGQIIVVMSWLVPKEDKKKAASSKT